MNFFKRWNNITGWTVFAIAAIVYLLTIEPVSSLWDCSEFIATSYKLEVGHPPGAPLFMLLARIATLFAGGNPNGVPIAVNSMSSLASAFCILFLFWTITHLARRLLTRNGHELTRANGIAVLGAGAVGALAYTFTDTFWFSAIEGEVYAMSSMFTALVVWLMLKWEEQADEPGSSRWIVLIAYMMGLSIGVHILNLLTIPALVFIYYFRKTPKVTAKGVIYATLAALGILFFIDGLIIPYTVYIGAMFDVWFVNSLGLPVNSGMVVFALALIGVLGWLSWRTHKRGKLAWNVFLLSTTMILVGYSSYATVTIRAAANPPMNSNNPNNPNALLSLLNRDQYGARPLFFGPYYSAPATDYKYKKVWYVGEDGKYKSAQVVTGVEHPAQFTRFLPRIWDEHTGEKGYKPWAAYRTTMQIKHDDKGNIVRDAQGRPVQEPALEFGHKVYWNDDYYGSQTVTEPTFGENVWFAFNYQLSYMYWRYFMWNFTGRQNDIQATTSQITDGNWLSGIKSLDAARLGPQDNLPAEVANNKARNTYFFLPFILGLIGLVYQLNRDQRNFTIVLWLFVMTGIALVFYFNLAPNEPRERDYVYAGSFYAFCIWLGLGVLAIHDFVIWLTKHRNAVTAGVATVVCLGIPTLLAAQNWDDHDRSHRYMARDIGWDYLQSTLPNSIILNYGDNDTFPLWNNQEIYGVRPDVRIMNTSYLGGEWYIDEMKTRANEAAGVPFSLPKHKYTNNNDLVPVDSRIDRAVDIRDVMAFIRSDDPKTQLQLSDGTMQDYIPTKTIALPVNKENAIASGIVAEKDRDLMVDTVYIKLNQTAIDKSQLMILDMLANFDWKRPIYLTQFYLFHELGLLDYLQFDGYAYRFVPIRTPVTDAYEIGRIDPDYAAPLLDSVFRYGNMSDPRVYSDYFTQYNISAAHARESFARVAKELLRQKRVDEAVALLDKGLKELPTSQIRFNDSNTYPFIEAYYAASAMGAKDAGAKGDSLLTQYAGTLTQYLNYYMRFDGAQGDAVSSVIDDKLSQLGDLYYLAAYADRKPMVAEINKFYRDLGVSEENLLDGGDKPAPADSTAAPEVK